MEIIIVAACTFLLCWLLDKGFTKFFRGRPQHSSGKSLRLSKHYGGFGTLLFVIGVAALIAGFKEGIAMTVGGVVMIVLGAGLAVYYLTFGVYYDDEGFVFSAFGKKSRTYAYRDIEAQQLYVSGRQVIVELYMRDGKAVQINSGLSGMYAFMDYAFARWLQQTGRKAEDCTFHDPDNSCWFPPVEG